MAAVLLGGVAALAWGTHDFLARGPSRGVGPANSAFAVTTAGLVALSVWVLFAGTAIHIAWASLWLVAAAGVLFALATLALFSALAQGPISIVAPVAGSYPALALLLSVFGGARPGAIEWLAAAVVLVGIALVSRSGAAHEQTGDLLPGRLPLVLGYAVLASLSFALAFTFGQVAVPLFGHVQTTWLARIFGLLFTAALFLIPSVRFRIPRRWAPVLGTMGFLDVSALLAVIAAGNFPNPAYATVVSSGFGVVAVVLARIFLRERIARVQAVGIALVFLGVGVLASR